MSVQLVAKIEREEDGNLRKSEDTENVDLSEARCCNRTVTHPVSTEKYRHPLNFFNTHSNASGVPMPM
jgi:hypothetical protein